MEAVAKLNGVRMSARKMRLAVDLIRGKKVEEALGILRFTKKEASTYVEKAVVSAIANWENKLGGMENADDYDLFVKTAYANEAGMLKRFRPAPHGRAHRIRKRSCHVTIVVENRVALPGNLDTAEIEEVEEASEE